MVILETSSRMQHFKRKSAIQVKLPREFSSLVPGISVRLSVVSTYNQSLRAWKLELDYDIFLRRKFNISFKHNRHQGGTGWKKKH
jgi:hypothetical protein